MPTFKMQPTTGDASKIVSAKLGATTALADRLGTNDVEKPVKLGGASRYVPTADGDEIEGFVAATEAWTTEGYAFGSVQTSGRKEVKVSSVYSVGGLVVAGVNAAVGTANTNGLPVVKAGAPTRFLWRVVEGSGAANSTAIIERI